MTMHARSHTSRLLLAAAMAVAAATLHGCSTAPAKAGGKQKVAGVPAKDTVDEGTWIRLLAMDQVARRNLAAPSFPQSWVGVWRGQGMEHLADGSLVPHTVELCIALEPETERWRWVMEMDREIRQPNPDGTIGCTDAKAGKWTVRSGGRSVGAWYAKGSLSSETREGDMRELTVYRLDKVKDTEFIDFEVMDVMERAAATATPLGTSGPHPGSVLRVRLERIEFTPPEPVVQR